MILRCCIVLFVFLVVFQIYDYYFNKCNTNHIAIVCDLVRKHPDGNKFCQKLCNEDKIEFLKCLSTGSGKFVYEVIINGKHLVLKSRHNHKSQGSLSDSTGELDVFVAWNSSMWIVHYFGQCKDIYAVEPIKETAGQKFGNDESLIELLDLPDPFNVIINTLSNQFPKSGFFNYCIVSAKRAEKLITSLISHMLSQNKPSFADKVKFTRGLFLMLEGMHISSHGRLQMCDVHIDNFGYTRNGEVRIIDADDIYFLDEISEKLRNKFCSSDSDCKIGDYNDCHSHCDPATKTCSTVASITNVKNVCNILMSVVFNDISEDELDAFQMPYGMMAKFSKSDAISLDKELSRIRIIIDHINKMKV